MTKLAPPPEPQPPLPWVSIIIDVVILLLAVAFYKKIKVFDATVLGPDLVHDSAHWWRLVTASFVHGKNMIFPCLSALGLAWTWGGRAERAFGSGGTLTVYVVGSIVGNLIRCVAEREGFLSVGGTGGIVAGVALAGAAVSGVVRTRSGGLAGTLIQAVFSAGFAVLFSTIEQGVGIGEDVVRMLPAVGAAFVLGGFLGIVLPLRTSAAARPVRALLFVIAFGVTAVSGFFLFSTVRPASRVHENEPETPKAPPMATHDSAALGLSFAAPLFMTEQQLRDPGQGAVVGFGPTFSQFPQLYLQVVPRGDFFNPEGQALRLADSERQDDASAKLLSQGALECPLGEAYCVALSVSKDGDAHTNWHCFVYPKTTTNLVYILLRSEPDDETARPTIEAVARSLKLRSGPADKEDDPSKRGRPR